MKVILVTGMLASGKSIALRVFQDLGYYCIDNLPPSLIISFVELAKKSDPQIEKVAFVVDARGEAFFNELDKAMLYLKSETNCEILFVDANDEVLIQRYKLMRRKHLMADHERMEETILRERKTLEPLRKIANYFIDTSITKDKEFKQKMFEIFSSETDRVEFVVNIVSFGFKYGILKDADDVFDVRFLPNPYYIDDLKPLTGLDCKVKDYVFDYPETGIFIQKVCDLFEFLIPCYAREGKQQLIIGIGCSGGRHRSVAVAEEVGKKLSESNYIVTVEHRDLLKDEYM